MTSARLLFIGIAGVALGMGLMLAVVGFSPQRLDPGPAILPQGASPSHPIIDGIPCLASETIGYHVHAKLDVYVHGRLFTVPPFIGIPDTPPYCFYYLHTHDLASYAQGTIHLEYPSKPAQATLKQFLDIWLATRSDDAKPVVRMLHGGPHVRYYVDGRRFHGNASTLPLVKHELITVEIGRPLVPPLTHYRWPAGV